MKSVTLLSLVSAVALAIAFVLSAEAVIAAFCLIGVTAIAVSEYSREIRPLVPVAVRATVISRSAQALRLAA